MTKEEFKKKIFDLDCGYHEDMIASWSDEELEKIKDVYIKEVLPEIKEKLYPRVVLGFIYKK